MFGIRDHHKGAQQIIALTFTLLLACCAATPVVVAVDLPLAKPPAGTLTASPAAPKLPEGQMSVAAFAGAYGVLQGQYTKETRRFAVLQRYVRALHKRKRKIAPQS